MSPTEKFFFETDHHDGLRLELYPFSVVDETDHLIVDDLRDVVLHALSGRRRLVLGTVLDAVRQIEYELDVHIGFQEGTLKIFADIVDEVVVDGRSVADTTEDASQGFSQSFHHHLNHDCIKGILY